MFEHFLNTNEVGSMLSDFVFKATVDAEGIGGAE